MSIIEYSIANAETAEQINSVKELFLEYARSLDFNLCFQNFEKELSELPGDYSSPGGALLLLSIGGKNAGCVALRKIDDRNCEMKRLYVRTVFRGKGLGKILALAIIEEAKRIGYETMRLDTVPSMKEAIELYRKLSFKQVEPYRYNPVAGAIYMELCLKDFKTG